MNKDEFFMQKAIQLAGRKRYKNKPKPLAGAVLVKGDQIIAQGYQKTNAEPHAVSQVLYNLAPEQESTIYTNIEPCFSPEDNFSCAKILVQKGIKRCVIGTLNPAPEINGKGVAYLRAQGMEVTFGVLEEKCRQLNVFYFKYIQTGLPFVTVKYAQSLDGRLATATGQSQWISSGSSLRLAHQLRSIHDGILIGIGTLLKDNPRLTVRLVKGTSPLRIIVDTGLKIPLTANVLNDEHIKKTIIVTTKAAEEKKMAAIEKRGAKILKVNQDPQGQVDLREAFFRLGKIGVHSVMVEGGAKVITSLLKNKLVDRLVITIAPKIIGQGIEAVGELGVKELKEAINFDRIRFKKMGADLIFEGEPVNQTWKV